MGTRIAIVVCVVMAAMLAMPSQASAKAPTAAVMPLGMGAGDKEFQGLGRSLADMMVSDLSQSQQLRLVERTQLGLILSELKLSKSGYLDKRTAQKLGRGLGAEYVITGSFSVIKDNFTMVCRIFRVETGEILKSVQSSGPVADFVAVEKDVVEKLLDGLSIRLSLGERRKMQLAAPTENVRALANYGRGVEASEEGQTALAKAAFEEALRRDPDFTNASKALADLAVAIEKVNTTHRIRKRTEREKTRAAAIAAIPSELTRKKTFVDSRRTLMDFAIRQYLLGLEKQHCQRYAELKHYLLRKDGNVIPWFQGLGPSYQDSWKAAEPIMAKRAFALGLIRRLRGHSATTFFHEASRNLNSGVSLLVWASISAQHSVLLTELAYCHPKNVEIAEFTRLQKIASRWPWYKKSVSTTLGEGPSTITAQDSMDLYWAYLRSKSRGVGRKVRMRTDAVLARHPPSDPKHGMVISRIQKIVATGQGYERSQAARMGLRETELAGRVRAALDGDKARLWMSSPMCTEFLKAQTYVLKSAWKSYKGLNPRGRTGLTRKESAIDRLGSSIGPLVYAECYRTKKARRPLSATKVLAQIRRGVKRLHPHPRKSSKCGAAVQQLTADSGSYSLATGRIDKLGYLLSRLHTLQTRRCLVP